MQLFHLIPKNTSTIKLKLKLGKRAFMVATMIQAFNSEKYATLFQLEDLQNIKLILKRHTQLSADIKLNTIVAFQTLRIFQEKIVQRFLF